MFSVSGIVVKLTTGNWTLISCQQAQWKLNDYDYGSGVCGCTYACMPVEQENKTNTVYINDQFWNTSNTQT